METWRLFGKCRLGKDSSLRKRMRAARRGLLPGEIEQAIKESLSETALMRHAWYRKKKFFQQWRDSGLIIERN